MAIAFDAVTNGGITNAGTQTFAHTVTGASPVLIVGCVVPTGRTATAKYNGVAMTEINHVATPNGAVSTVYLFYLINPATGANNVVITYSSSGGSQNTAGSMSYTGTNQSTQPDSSNTASIRFGTPMVSPNTTVVASGCWLVGICAQDANSPEILGPGFGSPRVDNNSGTFALGMNDSNGTVGTGSQHLAWTNGFGSTINWAAVTASISPALPALSSVSGVANASISSVSGVSLANIKSVSGVNNS